MLWICRLVRGGHGEYQSSADRIAGVQIMALA